MSDEKPRAELWFRGEIAMYAEKDNNRPLNFTHHAPMCLWLPEDFLLIARWMTEANDWYEGRKLTPPVVKVN